MDANVTENCCGTKALRRSIRELNAAKWKSGEIQCACSEVIHNPGPLTLESRKNAFVPGSMNNFGPTIRGEDTIRTLKHAKRLRRSHVHGCGAAEIHLDRGSAMCPSGNRRLDLCAPSRVAT